MDALNEQLSKLKKLNSRPLSPRIYTSEDNPLSESTGGSKVVTLAHNLQEAPYITIPKDLPGNGECKVQPLSPSGLSPSRKVGPIVPPKPLKSIKLPEVPQSMLIRQSCEPLYSKRLQSNRSCDPAFIDVPLNEKREKLDSNRPPLLHRKQPTYAGQHNPFFKMNKVTLDNPAILEQQLEALAHHKMQLEKKGLLQQQNAVVANISCIPKLSTSSLLNDVKKSGSNTNLISMPKTLSNVYSNVPHSHPNKNVSTALENDLINAYSNVTLYEQQERAQEPFGVGGDTDFVNTGGGFRNALYENNTVLNLPILSQDALSIANSKSADYLKNQNDDDIPAPPSPVSSSYSELRRATNVFVKGPTNVNLQQFHDVRIANNTSKNSNMQYPQFDENITSSKVLSTADSAGPQQTYMNVNFANDYNTYSDSPSMQGSSTYESIYEPINPRPPSQLSSRSNYLMYVQYVNTPSSTDGTTGSNTNSSSNLPVSSAQHSILPSTVLPNDLHNPKESEVEALTDFLVHSMDSSNDVDSYGVCVKCNERVVGENSGCTAMKQIYHISCFTCSQCQINLQGKPFYALEGKPYCEYDYLQTLEKCSVCMKPILERILRATGKPYHPQCFTCVVCGNSLDGIPFTVDATNQNYCIADFHKKFAPRCCVCKQPIMPEPGQEETVRVVALDRSFHFECYKCEDCELLLSSEAEGRGCYPLDDHVLCKSCNAQRVQMLTNRMTTEL